MAVTKIRKMSSWTLLIVSLISIVVLGMFFGGGITNPGEEMKEPMYIQVFCLIGLQHYSSSQSFAWCYLLFGSLSTLLKVNR